MASESVANLLDVLKQVWTQDRLERQFYDQTKWLDKVERTNKFTIGRTATVPMEVSLPGGTTTTGPAGSAALNPADVLHVDTVDYTLSQLFQQVSLQLAAINQGVGPGAHSTVDALDQTIKSNVDALRREANRQMVGNQDALIAQCTTSTTTTTINLLSTGYGPDALKRGWLRKGMTVDIGTTASEAAVVGDVQITAVDLANNTITISGSNVSTTSSHYVSVANNRSGATSLETNGLRNILGSASTTIGGLAPSTEATWQPASVDTSTTLVSLDLLVSLQQATYQQTGHYPTDVFTSPKQAGELYKLFQSQTRFDGDSSSVGNVLNFKWAGFNITVDPDIPDRELYLINLPDFLIVTGAEISKPTWMSEISGNNKGSIWGQGTTAFVDALAYPVQLGVKRRNASAAAIGLTA